MDFRLNARMLHRHLREFENDGWELVWASTQNLRTTLDPVTSWSSSELSRQSHRTRQMRAER
jgi:hypothetical protein